MRKKLFSLALALAVALSLPPAPALAAAEWTDYTLSDDGRTATVYSEGGFAYVTEGGGSSSVARIVLGQDIFLTSYYGISHSCEIDLNGKALSGNDMYKFAVLSIRGDVTVKISNGAIESLCESSSCAAVVMKSHAQLVMENVVLTSKTTAIDARGAPAVELRNCAVSGSTGIVIVGEDKTNGAPEYRYPGETVALRIEGSSVTATGAELPAISGTSADCSSPVFVIDDSTVTACGGPAIFLPQQGGCDLRLGGTGTTSVTGATGVSMKSGALTVESGTAIRGTGAYQETLIACDEGIDGDGSAILLEYDSSARDGDSGCDYNAVVTVSGGATLESANGHVIRVFDDTSADVYGDYTSADEIRRSKVASFAPKSRVSERDTAEEVVRDSPTVVIAGGAFKAAGGKAPLRISTDVKNPAHVSVSGGVYSAAVDSAFLAAGYECAAVADAAYPCTVRIRQSAEAPVTGAGTVEGAPAVAPCSSAAGSAAAEVLEALTAGEQRIHVDVSGSVDAAMANGEIVTTVDTETAAAVLGVSQSEQSVVYVVRTYPEVKIVEAARAAASADGAADQAAALTLDIEIRYDLLAAADADAPAAGESEGRNAVTVMEAQLLKVTRPATVTLPLPENFFGGDVTRVYVRHTHGDGSGAESVYQYTGAILDDTLTFVSRHGFSEFTVTTSGEDVTVNDLPTDRPLQEALDEALQSFDGGPIVIEYSGADVLTVDAGYPGVFTMAGPVTVNAGPGMALTGTGNADGSTTYSVSAERFSVNVDTLGDGSVDAPGSAEMGERITVLTDPGDGYEVDFVAVLDPLGREIEVSGAGGGAYAFRMPDASVDVYVAFKPIASAGETTVAESAAGEASAGETNIGETTAGEVNAGEADAGEEAEGEADASRFRDVARSAYYFDAVSWAVREGVAYGTTGDSFEPEGSCTRAQMVTFLWRAAGCPIAGGSSPFTDVRAGAYYYDAALWAAANGIARGTGNGTFSPDETVSRGQTVTFLYRAAGSPAVGTDVPFTDVDAGAYYAAAVRWAVDRGVTAGVGATAFSPDTDCTRGQIVTFLYRARQAGKLISSG